MTEAVDYEIALPRIGRVIAGTGWLKGTYIADGEGIDGGYRANF